MAQAGRRPSPVRRQHAVELVLDEDGDARVRARWDLLERAGVPSSARHRGATHRPHVTVVAGPAPSEDLLRLAAELFGPALPMTLSVSGLVLLGGRRPALAELLVPPPETVVARARLAAAWAGSDARPWVPHLTLAPRLGEEEVAAALTALRGASPEAPVVTVERVAVALRWWDPDSGTASLVCGQDP